MPLTVHHLGVPKRCHTSRFLSEKSLRIQGLSKWRRPHQPHPGTRCSRYGCSLPGLTRLTGNRCGGTDGATTTRLIKRRAAPLYRSCAKLQPLPQEKTNVSQGLGFMPRCRGWRERRQRRPHPSPEGPVHWPWPAWNLRRGRRPRSGSWPRPSRQPWRPALPA